MDLSCVCLQKQSERRPSLAPVLCTTTLFPFSFGKLVDGKIQIRKPAKKNAKWHDSRYSSSINLSKALDGFDSPEWRIDPILSSRLESLASAVSYGQGRILEWWWITRHLPHVFSAQHFGKIWKINSSKKKVRRSRISNSPPLDNWIICVEFLFKDTFLKIQFSTSAAVHI
jgi:hypothetical protein